MRTSRTVGRRREPRRRVVVVVLALACAAVTPSPSGAAPAAAASAPAAPAADRPAVTIPVERTRLQNGLTVLVHEDRSAPVVSVYLFYRSGSRNERPGATGIAHLFEHMMFNGGEHSQGKFDEIIETNGGSTNGYTTRDFTAYMENFPVPALERVLWLEADRMRALAITPENLEQERGIVKEERRLRIDDDPGGKMYEEVYLAAYVASTYRWNTVGFMADLERITLEDAKSYFRTYYAPNNATLVLAGALTPADGFALAARYFGAVPSQTPPRPVVNDEPPQRGPKRVEFRGPAELPALAVAYHAVPAGHADRPALDVLETILSDGESSRLYRALVRGPELATGVSVSFNWGIDPELFWFYGQIRPGKTPAAFERALLAEVERVRERPPDEHEMRKAKNLLEADYVRGLKTVSGKANQIGFYETVFGDYAEMFREVARWEAVTAADVQRVARTYLVERARTIVELVPERTPAAAPRRAGAPAAGAPEKP
jgi:zinc protease